MEACLLFFTTFSFFLTSSFPLSLSQPDKEQWDCPPSRCGRVEQIDYPFWSDAIWRPPYCGRPGFQLNCPPDGDHYPTIQIDSQTFTVTEIDKTAHTMRMVRTDFAYDNCSSSTLVTNTSVSISSNLFHYDEPSVKNMTLFYNCSQDYSTVGIKFPCQHRTSSNPNSNNYAFYPEHLERDPLLPDLIKNCKHHVQLPVSIETDQDYSPALLVALGKGFRVQYDVEKSPGKGISLKNKVLVGVITATVVVLVMLTLFYFYQRRKKTTGYAKSYILSRTPSVSSKTTMDPEINASKYFGVPVFTYAELEEATNNFDSARELGDGGFGTVYFGKLQDGREVAVKRLYENNYRRVEQFINEVQILTRLRHVNLVSLYGCTSRRSRELLLVYEYIPNGTLADHLHGDRARPGSLSWNIRISIAIETASALAYLHNSDIIHRDVKTNNILLDNHFVVKVADFGLSRLFPDHVTHISTAPQGTPGYVDPEYHECYQLTVKSDVYSFGVVLIELISSLPAVDITRHRHEINLSTMAINKIQNRALHELVDPALGFESDQMVRKMINAVAELAFQCLQNLKDMRPSMEEVLETLKDIESDGKHRSKAEVMDISADDDVGLHKKDLPPPSLDSNLASKSTTSNSSS